MPWIAVCVETGVILLSTIGAVYILRETTMFHVKQWGKDMVLRGLGCFTSPAKRAYNDLKRLETAVFAWQWSGQNIMRGKKERWREFSRCDLSKCDLYELFLGTNGQMLS